MLFSDNSVLKSLLGALTRTQNAPVANKFHKGAFDIVTFLVVFVGIALKLGNGGPAILCKYLSPQMMIFFGGSRQTSELKA